MPRPASLIAQKGVSVWLNADLDVLMRRIKRRSDRPSCARQIQRRRCSGLMDERYPVYALADVTIESRDVSHEVIVDETIEAMLSYFGVATTPGAAQS